MRTRKKTKDEEIATKRKIWVIFAYKFNDTFTRYTRMLTEHIRANPNVFLWWRQPANLFLYSGGIPLSVSTHLLSTSDWIACNVEKKPENGRIESEMLKGNRRFCTTHSSGSITYTDIHISFKSIVIHIVSMLIIRVCTSSHPDWRLKSNLQSKLIATIMASTECAREVSTPFFGQRQQK